MSVHRYQKCLLKILRYLAEIKDINNSDVNLRAYNKYIIIPLGYFIVNVQVEYCCENFKMYCVENGKRLAWGVGHIILKI